MRTASSSLTVALGLSVALLGGCTGYASGVDGNKPVADLTDEEYEVACENLSDYLLATFPESRQDSFNCYLRGLSVISRTPAECQTVYDDCMRSPPNIPFDIQPLDCSTPFIDASCDATVSEVEVCITADTDAYGLRLAEVDCSVSGNVPELQRLLSPVTVPDSCAVLSARCPSYGDGFYPRFGD